MVKFSSREKGSLTEVVADDPGGERQQGAVVGELRADGVHHRDALLADAVHKPRNSDHRVAAERHRVEPAIREARVNHIHLVEAGDGFEIDLVVEDEEVAALHERNAHAAPEEAVLGVGGTARAGCEQDDHRIGLSGVGTQHFHNARGDIGDRVDAGIVERLRNHAGEGAPVLDHVGNARGVAEVVVLHGEAAIGEAANREAAEVQKCSARRGHASRRPLEKLAPHHGRDRNHAIVEDLPLRIHVAQKKLERTEALADSFGERLPFGGRENLGQQVAEPSALSPWAFAVDVECHTHLAHGRLETLVEIPHLGAGHAVQAVEEGAINFTGLTVRTEGLVVGAKMPGRFHRAAKNSRAVLVSQAMPSRRASRDSNFFSGRRKSRKRTSSSHP